MLATLRKEYNSSCEQRIQALSHEEFTIYEPSRLNIAEIEFMDRVMKFEKYMTAIPLKHWQSMENVWTIYKDEEFVGLVAAIPAGADCFEIGPVYLYEAYRGKGITSKVLSLIEEKLSDQFLFTMSHNPAYQKIMDGRSPYYWSEVALKLPIMALPPSAIISTIKGRLHWSGIREYFRKKSEGISVPGKDRWWIHMPSTVDNI